MISLNDVKIVAKNVCTIGGLFAALPISAAIVAAASVYRVVRMASSADSAKRTLTGRKTVLISGGKMTKALQLARSFHAAGHRVILAESAKYRFTGHRFSRAVARFYALPKPDAPDYANALLRIVTEERVDAYVPVCSPLASRFDSEAIPLLAPLCDVIHIDPQKIQLCDDKYQFAKTAERLGLAVPKTFLITDAEQVADFDFSQERRQYILKSIAYDSVRRLDLTKLPAATPAATAAFARSLPISDQNPWILQEFIPGQEYCTHGTIRNGELRVHCCCPSSAFQVNYEHVEIPEIEAWITTFVQGIGITGQASFDFIHAADDKLFYAIECNPRTHSAITMFYDHPGVADAYLNSALQGAPIRPLTTSRPTYWIVHEIWRLLSASRSLHTFAERLRIIARGKDAVFSRHDPLPFLMLHHLHIPLLLLRDLVERRGWIRIDFNIGKLVQSGGD